MTESRGLDLLVLGGTSWLGGVVARRALERGHRVTCLARGESGDPPAGATWVRADRASSSAYDKVAEARWDAALDVSWQPDFVRSALGRLAGTTQHWIYVSSCSVYADDTTPGTDETAPVHDAYQGAGPVDWDAYGPAKVACERACLEALGAERVLLARAGLIGGYGDRSDRLGYWPGRLARAADGESVLVPPLRSACQVIDVEDLAGWLVSCAEQRVSGTFNAIGDEGTVGAVVDASTEAAGTSPHLVEVTDEWLVARGVEPWMGPESLPLWLPQSDYAGFMARRNAAARAAGLRLRPLADTVRATLRWERESGLERARRAGLSTAREQELLDRLN
jgi:nucleoside-diphosphate-sugar epimerase